VDLVRAVLALERTSRSSRENGAQQDGAQQDGARQDGARLPLRRLIEAHRIAPALRPWRHQLDLDPEDLRWLDATERDDIAQSLRNADRICRLANGLHSAGIRALFFKGLPLAVRTTGSLAGRRCRDIDLLVCESDLSAADEVLRYLGLTLSAGPGSSPLSAPYRWWAATMTNQVTYRQVGGLPVELHWRLSQTGLLPLEFERLWASNQPVTLGGSAVPAFGPVHELLHCAVHATGSGFRRLHWLMDVVRLLRGASAETWDQTLTLAGELRVTPILGLAVAAAQRLDPDLRLSLPDQAKVSRRLGTRPWPSPLLPLENRAELRWQLRLRTGFRYRLKTLARAAMPPPLLDSVRLPWPAAYLTLPLRVLVPVRFRRPPVADQHPARKTAGLLPHR
jgi:hypothetical protein